jgi:hypothetical protein
VVALARGLVGKEEAVMVAVVMEGGKEEKEEEVAVMGEAVRVVARGAEAMVADTEVTAEAVLEVVKAAVARAAALVEVRGEEAMGEVKGAGVTEVAVREAEWVEVGKVLGVVGGDWAEVVGEVVAGEEMGGAMAGTVAVKEEGWVGVEMAEVTEVAVREAEWVEVGKVVEVEGADWAEAVAEVETGEDKGVKTAELGAVKEVGLAGEALAEGMEVEAKVEAPMEAHDCTQTHPRRSLDCIHMCTHQSYLCTLHARCGKYRCLQRTRQCLCNCYHHGTSHTPQGIAYILTYTRT